MAEETVKLRYRIHLEYNRKKLVIFDTTNPSQEFALVDPNLHLEQDNAGSFEATFPITNVALVRSTRFQWLSKNITRVVIAYTKGENVFKTIWRGRLVSAEEDFYGQVHTYFEGDLSTLNDAITIPSTYHYSATASSGGSRDPYITDYRQWNFSGNTFPLVDILNIHNDRILMKNLDTDPNADNYDDMYDYRMWYIDVGDPLDATYEKLATEPEDWSTNYTHYYIQKKTKYQTLYTNVTGYSAPTFVANKYYKRLVSTMTKGIPQDVFAQGDLVIENETTLSAVQKIIDNFGGHYRVLYDAPMNTKGEIVDRSRMQWVEVPKEFDPDTPVTQYIAFGKNLIDFTRKTEVKDFVSCIRPRGKKIHSAGSTALGVNYRVASINQGFSYMQLTEKPSDWETNFWSYYELRRDVFCPIPKTYKVPEFNSNIHYNLAPGYTVLTEKPSNWDSNYTSYYEFRGGIFYPIPEAQEAPEFVANTYYSYAATALYPLIKDHSGGITIHSFACASWTGIYQNNSSSSSREMDKFDYRDLQHYISTGFWASQNAKGYAPPNDYQNSFYCSPGEKYYILATGNYSADLKITACLISDGVFRSYTENGDSCTWYFTPVSNTQMSQVSTGRSGVIYKLVTIPEYKWGNGMYVNLTARVHDNDPYPVTYEHLHMDIWGTRTVDSHEDEYITLCGLDNGTWAAYMGTVKNDTQAGRDKMQNPDVNTSENIPIFVEPITVDGTNFDGYFLYPYLNSMDPESQSQIIGFYDSASSYPAASTANVNKYLANITTGDVFKCVAEAGGEYKYEKVIGERLYYKKADAIYDVKLVKEYGVVETIVTYNDVDDPKKLRTLACETLYNAVFEKLSLSVTALDLALLESNIDVPRIMDPIHIVSEYHNVDLLLPLQSMDIPFNKLENQTFNIGYEKEQKITDRQKVKNIKKG